MQLIFHALKVKDSQLFYCEENYFQSFENETFSKKKEPCQLGTLLKHSEITLHMEFLTMRYSDSVSFEKFCTKFELQCRKEQFQFDFK